MKNNNDTLWIIANTFVAEPYLGGMQLGELPEYDVTGYTLIHYTQDELDKMMEEYNEEHGYYPGT